MNEPPTCALCAGHQNATQTGKVSFKIRKIQNCQSTGWAGRCAFMKIALIVARMCVSFSSSVLLYRWADCLQPKLCFTYSGWLSPGGKKHRLLCLTPQWPKLQRSAGQQDPHGDLQLRQQQRLWDGGQGGLLFSTYWLSSQSQFVIHVWLQGRGQDPPPPLFPEILGIYEAYSDTQPVNTSTVSDVTVYNTVSVQYNAITNGDLNKQNNRWNPNMNVWFPSLETSPAVTLSESLWPCRPTAAKSCTRTPSWLGTALAPSLVMTKWTSTSPASTTSQTSRPWPSKSKTGEWFNRSGSLS